MVSCETNTNNPLTPSEIVIALLVAAWLALWPIILINVGGVF